MSADLYQYQNQMHMNMNRDADCIDERNLIETATRQVTRSARAFAPESETGEPTTHCTETD